MASSTSTPSNSNSGDEVTSQAPSLRPISLPTPIPSSDAMTPPIQTIQPASGECLKRSRETSGKDIAEPEEVESSPKRIKPNDGGWSYISRQLREWAQEEGISSGTGESSTTTPDYVLSSKVVNQALTTLTCRCSR